MSNVDLSVIIVSFNVEKLLEDCLKSAFEEIHNRYTRDTPRYKFEVIVVDNSSSDDSCQMVKKRFPWVKLIELRENLGFAKANNLGAKKAGGKYLLFLNPDTKIC